MREDGIWTMFRLPKRPEDGGSWMIYSRKNKRDGIVYWFVRYDLPNGRRRKEKAGTCKQDAVDLFIADQFQRIFTPVF